jgi:hypothetical protein
MGHAILKRRLALLALLLATNVAQAVEVSNVHFDDRARLNSNGPELVLNGAGMRTKAIFRLYVVGLYLTEKKATAADVLALKGAKRLQLTVMRDLTAEQLIDAINLGLRQNISPADLARLKPQADALFAIMTSLRQAKMGSTIIMDYLPESGMRVLMNGEIKGAPVAGADFYDALLKIWLGEDPAQESLKRAMLGGEQ